MNNVLFVCTFWGVRSEIARIIAESKSDEQINFQSAGLESGAIGPLVRDAMSQRGLELQSHSPTTLFERVRRGEKYDDVITLCHRHTQEQSEILLGVVEQLFPPPTRVEHWDIPDFMSIQNGVQDKAQAAAGIIDEIESKVVEFLEKS